MSPFSVRCLVPCLVLTVMLFAAGCSSLPRSHAVDREADARACLREVMASYEGKSYKSLRKKIDASQDSRHMRKHGHRYLVLVMVSYDVEHRPDGIQVDFDVFDADLQSTMIPVNDTVYLRPGEVVHAPRR